MLENKEERVKKTILILLVSILCLFGCSSPKQDGYKAGTYQGSATGRNGDVVVEVTLSESAIEKIEVIEHSESEGFAEPAIEKVPFDIIKYQSLNVDTVSGATITSEAIIEAVTNALKEAGVDVEVLKNKEIEKEKAGETIEKTADVIIVGGGGAGISAATAVTEEGKSVILIEKTASLGGNTLASGGVWNAVNNEIGANFEMEDSRFKTLRDYLEYDEDIFEGEFKETYKVLKSQINEYLDSGSTTLFDSVEFHLIQSYLGGMRKDLDGNEINGDYDLLYILTSKSDETIKWLEDTTGSKFSDKILIEPNGALWLRSQLYENSKLEDLFNKPKEYVLNNGGEIIFECTAKELIVDNGRVVGVKAVMSDGTEVVLNANNGVILATGGFGANFEMVKEYDNYWGDILDKVILSTNVDSTVGEGIIMAQEAVDAAVIGMEFTQLNPIGFASNGSLAQGNGGNVFYVTPEGVRFVNEYAERDVVSIAALTYGGEGGLFYEIGLKSNMAPSMSLWQDADCYEAKTLEELAEMIGIDPDVLVNETNKYNGYVESGVDPEFDKNVFTSKIEIVEEGDLYVARALRPSIHHTMGGLVIDKDTHVYNTSGEIIEGLYAAGEVTGGIHAGNRLGGNAIADVYTFGKIAGKNAAEGK